MLLSNRANQLLMLTIWADFPQINLTKRHHQPMLEMALVDPIKFLCKNSFGAK